MLLDWAAALGTGKSTVGSTVRYRGRTGSRQEVHLPPVALKSLLKASLFLWPEPKEVQLAKETCGVQRSALHHRGSHSGLGTERTAQ